MGLIDYAAISLEKGGKLQASLKEVVMGLHWDPAQPGSGANVADLDALCLLFDAGGQVLEVIHSGHLRNASESVVHTGDSLTGASIWDDERIFVFLDALPDTVQALAFVVVSANDRSLHLAPGAYCHISDRYTEQKLLHLDLSTLDDCQAHAAGCLRRGNAGWHIGDNATTLVGATLLGELHEQVMRSKHQSGKMSDQIMG